MSNKNKNRIPVFRKWEFPDENREDSRLSVPVRAVFESRRERTVYYSFKEKCWLKLYVDTPITEDFIWHYPIEKPSYTPLLSNSNNQEASLLVNRLILMDIDCSEEDSAELSKSLVTINHIIDKSKTRNK